MVSMAFTNVDNEISSILQYKLIILYKMLFFQQQPDQKRLYASFIKMTLHHYFLYCLITYLIKVSVKLTYGRKNLFHMQYYNIISYFCKLIHRFISSWSNWYCNKKLFAVTIILYPLSGGNNGRTCRYSIVNQRTPAS